MSSPKYPSQFQHTPSLQLNKNQSLSCGSKVARALRLNTHIRLVPSLKFSGATCSIIMSAFMLHIGTILFHVYLLPMYLYQKITFFLVL